METRPILSAMWRNKTGAILIALQIAFTLAVVANALFIIYQRWEKVNRPTGMDTQNIVAFSSQWTGRDVNLRQAIEEDLRVMRALPGVVAASPTGSIPLSGGGWGGSLRTGADPESPRVSGGFFAMDEAAVATLGVNLISGSELQAQDVLWLDVQANRMPGQVLITQAMAEELFPDEEAVGKSVFLGRDTLQTTIAGVVERMHGAWVSWDGLERSVIVPTIDLTQNNIFYLVRMEPGRADTIMPQLEESLRDINQRRVVGQMQSVAEIAQSTYQSDSAMIWMLITVVGLLIIVTAVGIIGLAAFAVSQRKRQIGTRRALGARRFHILRYFLVENWLITSIGLALGAFLATAFNYWLVTSFELERLDWYYVPAGMAFLWILGLAAVYGPAKRATMVSPAIATRTV